MLSVLADPFADDPEAAPANNAPDTAGPSTARPNGTAPRTITAGGATQASQGVGSAGWPLNALSERWQKIRPYLWLPLGGPLVMTGFLGAIVNLFILGPLLSRAWRQR